MKTQLHILFTMLLSAGIGLFILLLAVGTAAAQQTLFTIEDAGGTVVLRVLDDGTVVAEKLDLQGGEGALQCTGCIPPGRLGDDAVESDNIADSAVQPQHIDGGIMNALTRNQLYMRSASKILSVSGVIDSATAVCDNLGDIPVVGECSSSQLDVVQVASFNAVGWDDTSVAAGYRCDFRSEDNSSATIEARIHCLDVTP